MIYEFLALKIVFEKVSCKGLSFQANPNMENRVVLIIARTKNCNKLGLVPLTEITLVPVNILAGVCKKISSNKRVYKNVVAKKK